MVAVWCILVDRVLVTGAWCIVFEMAWSAFTLHVIGNLNLLILLLREKFAFACSIGGVSVGRLLNP